MNRNQMIRCPTLLAVAMAGLSNCGGRSLRVARGRALSHSQIQGEGGKRLTDEQRKQDNEMIVRIEKGELVNLNLAFDVGFAKVVQGENKIQFRQDIYLLIYRKDGLMISPDGERFAPIHKVKAIKRLFGKKKGFLSVGAGISEEQGPHLTLGAFLK